jgi:anti-sigma regulatory factor (Ser/Thr protein kinase)
VATRRRPHPGHFRHEALFWEDAEELLAVIVPFATEAIEAGMPVMVAVPDDRWRTLRDALGPDAQRVQHFDLSRIGANPARITPAWRKFVEQAGGRPCRGIGEPIRTGMHPSQLAESQVNEAALNVAFPPDARMWLLCLYDVGTLDAAVLEEARRSHQIITSREAANARSVDYAGPDHAATLAARALPRAGTIPGTVAEFRRYRRGDLPRIRHFVKDRALAAGLDADRADDLCLAVSELTANSIDHGGGYGMLRMWREPGRLVVEVSDAGRITDPLVGRVNPTVDQARGRGLWMAHQLCDLLQIRNTEHGTVLRAVTWL